MSPFKTGQMSEWGWKGEKEKKWQKMNGNVQRGAGDFCIT